MILCIKCAAMVSLEGQLIGACEGVYCWSRCERCGVHGDARLYAFCEIATDWNTQGESHAG